MSSGHLTLLIIDMQHDFLDEHAPCECPECRRIVGNIRLLLDEARMMKVPVIHVITVWRHDGSEVPRFTTTKQVREGAQRMNTGR